jgi:hypothetical protein
MIRLDEFDQGSAAWAMARAGIPTASCFDKIITPKTMKLSETAVKYAWQLLAEQHTGAPMEDATAGFMARGEVMERKAVEYYELRRNVDTETVGLILRDDRRVGCSPDRLVGNDGLLEIKVPSAPVHISYLLDEEGIGYRAQVQGQLWVAEREWNDTLSYHPTMPEALVRIHRDEEFIGKLATAVNQFLEMVDDMKEKLSRRGMFPDWKRADLRVA